MSLQFYKNLLRTTFRNELFANTRLNTELKSQKILNNIIRNNILKDKHHIAIFKPIHCEPNVLLIIDAFPEKCFYVPKVIDRKSRHMEFVMHSDPKVRNDTFDLIFVPAISFDKFGNRLGYGGGFYDTFLSKYPNIPKYGIVFSEFVSNMELPSEPHDVKVNYVITQDGITNCINE